MKRRSISITTKSILIVCSMLLVFNGVLGIILIRKSGDGMKNLIRKHMISVAETASAMVDGDFLEAYTEEDIDSEGHEDVVHTLLRIKSAQDDVDIKYIYLVKKEGEHYVYTIDPDPEDPAGFGEEVVDTPMQNTAWAGVTAIDPEPVEDEWGNYYTCWSPIRNSEGTVIGLVGVDFSADWYNAQMSSYIKIVVAVCVLVLLITLLISILLTWQMQRRFRLLNSELTVLSDNVEALAEEVRTRSDTEKTDAVAQTGTTDSDIIRALSHKIHSTQSLLSDYMQYIQERAYMDDMTGVGNRDAYMERTKELNKKIDAGTAAFCLAIVDINGLKATNDNYGHECGDRIITDTARFITQAFGAENIYRIGGDEFIVIREDLSEETVARIFDRVDTDVSRFNREEKDYAMILSFSHGSAAYRPGEDSSYKDVFKRADDSMYQGKLNFYQNHGQRPRHAYEELSRSNIQEKKG